MTNANAARIVACVNALAGKNPAAVKDAVGALSELTAHAAHCLEKHGLPHNDAMMMLALVDQANAALTTLKS